VLDNRGLLLNDSRLREASVANLRLIFDHTYWWPNGESGLYRPFATLSYLFNYAILGNREQPGGYHWINLLLHTGNVLLVYALAVRLVRKSWPAFLIAAMWSVHPVLTESVTNIVGRSDLLAAGAVLGGLLLYIKSAETEGWRRVAWLTGLTVVSAIGMLSKETAAIIPGVIVLYELTFRRRWGLAQLFGLLATLAPLALMLYLRSRVLAGTLPMEIPFTDNPIAWASFTTGRLTALKVIARYFLLIAWPARLSADYSWSQIPLAQGNALDWIVGAAVIAIIAASVFLYRWNRAGFFLFWVGLAWLAPVSNLLFPTGTVMAERFLYLPALGLIACLVPPVFALAQKTGAAKPGLALLCLFLLCLLTTVLAARTWVRNADWKDDMSMASASVRTSPQSFKTHDLLANVLFASDPTHANIGRVIEESDKSLAILDPLPDERKPADPYRFAANCYMISRAYPKAIATLLRLIAIEGTERATGRRQAEAYQLLSQAYIASGQTDRASDAAAHARALDPLNPDLYRQTAAASAAAGRMDDAAVALVEGLFVTGDGSLRQDLVELYQHGMDSKSCALILRPNRFAINPACPIVHTHVCNASTYVVRILAAAQQGDLAQTRKKMFSQQFGCPLGPLEEALR
jgi:protein O-mannosyl-transferase